MPIKRRFSELRHLILQTIASGQKTVNQLSTETGINWKTVDNHLIFLAGKGYVREVFVSSYVKIFEITDRGRKALEKT